jgi:putative ABC transport system permease protein
MFWLLRDLSPPHFRRHALREVLTTLSIAAAVAAVLATAAVSGSVIESFAGGVRRTAGDADFQVGNSGAGLPEELVDELSSVGGVMHVGPFVEGFVPLVDDPSRSLLLFGFDVLADATTLGRVGRDAVSIDDELEFLVNADSVVLPRAYAAENGLAAGDALRVVGHAGPATLIVRGLVEEREILALNDGGMGFMDLPAAQQLLGMQGKVDRIDLIVDPAADAASLHARLDEVVGTHGNVHSASDVGARAKGVLHSLRVVLALAGAIASVVAFFIIYHTVHVSLMQRRHDIALLSALGVSGRQIMRWILLESAVLGGAASLLGLAFGAILARVSVRLFGTVSSAWIQAPDPVLMLDAHALLGAFAVGLVTTISAGMLATRAIVAVPGALMLRRGSREALVRGSASRVFAAGGLMLGAALLMLLLAPRTLPYRSLVIFILTVNCLILAGFGLLSPIALRCLANIAAWVGDRRPGVSLFLSSWSLSRKPTASVAVVTAIVMAFGWTLANASLIASFKSSWLDWLSSYYGSDLEVVAVGGATDILNARPFSGRVIERLVDIDGVESAQGLRRVEIEHDGRPAMLVAFDRSERPLPTVGSGWPGIAERFWAGDGVLIGDTLARRTGLDVGHTVVLPTSSGEPRMEVLGVLKDVYGGDLGSIALARNAYERRWLDARVDRIRVWLEPGTDPSAVILAINAGVGRELGIQAIEFATTVRLLEALIEDAFRLTYALVFVCLVVSCVGIVNFLLGSVIDRHLEFRTVHALGLSPWQTVGVVAVEGFIMSIAGVLVGLVSGAVVSIVIVQHCVPMVNGWTFDTVLPLSTTMLIAVVAVVFPTLAALVPGWSAVRAGRSPAWSVE